MCEANGVQLALQVPKLNSAYVVFVVFAVFPTYSDSETDVHRHSQKHNTVDCFHLVNLLCEVPPPPSPSLNLLPYNFLIDIERVCYWVERMGPAKHSFCEEVKTDVRGSRPLLTSSAHVLVILMGGAHPLM